MTSNRKKISTGVLCGLLSFAFLVQSCTAAPDDADGAGKAGGGS